MDKRQRITLWATGILLGMELTGFILLAYFATFSYFITQFVRTIQFLSPVFLWLYAAFITLIMIGRDQAFTRLTWKNYLVETLHFFLVSFLIAVAALAVCAVTGAMISSLCHFIASRPAVRMMMESLREWVRASFY
jgi:membrane-associated HD superfamily phosphohydrolase